MNPIDRGFVVPVWVWFGTTWRPGWMPPRPRSRLREAVAEGDTRAWLFPPRQVRPRDPNRAQADDRPDLLPGANQ